MPGNRHRLNTLWGRRVEIKVVAKNGQIPPSVSETIQQKVAKLPRFFERTTSIQVIADLQHAEQPRVEIKISAEERNDFFAADTGNNVLSALESVIEKIERQMRKHKEKLTDHHRARD